MSLNILHRRRFASNTDVYDISTGLNVSDLSVTDVMWLKPYLAADFPEITCDKKYLFLYSTDHDTDSTAGGEIWWGKGDNLDLSDFVEQGLIMSGYQSETPFLIRIPECGDSEVIHLYYHTSGGDPSNNQRQQTHLITTTGGTLHLATWTQRGTVLGGSEIHTGYFKLYKKQDGTYRGTHLSTSGIPQNYKFSTTTNGRSFTRDANLFQKTSFLVNRQYKVVSGTIFYKNSNYWFIGNDAPTDFNGNTKFSLVRLDENFQPTQFCKYFTPEIPILINKMNGDLEVYIEGEIAYFYWKEGTEIKTGKYDLSDLLNYLNPPVVPENTISIYDLGKTIIDRVSGNNIPNPIYYVFSEDAEKGIIANFEGNDNAITTNAAEFQQNNIGVEIVFKSSGTGTGLKGIVTKQFAWGIFADSGILKLYSWGAPTGFKATTVNLNDNVWRKINVELRNGVTNGTKIFIDDVLVLTTTYAFTSQTEKITIGNGDDGSGTPSSQNINGQFEKVRIYNIDPI